MVSFAERGLVGSAARDKVLLPLPFFIGNANGIWGGCSTERKDLIASGFGGNIEVLKEKGFV